MRAKQSWQVISGSTFPGTKPPTGTGWLPRPLLSPSESGISAIAYANAIVGIVWAAGTVVLVLALTSRLSPGVFLCGMFAAALWGYGAWRTWQGTPITPGLAWWAIAPATMVELRAGAYSTHLVLAIVVNSIPALLDLFMIVRGMRVTTRHPATTSDPSAGSDVEEHSFTPFNASAVRDDAPGVAGPLTPVTTPYLELENLPETRNLITNQTMPVPDLPPRAIPAASDADAGTSRAAAPASAAASAAPDSSAPGTMAATKGERG